MKRKYSVIDTAKLIRKELKSKFPDCKFSVVSHKYAGGASINICYRDYLPESEIEKVVKRFQGSEFDSTQDLKTPCHTLEIIASGSLEEVRYMADYIFLERHYSELYNYYLCKNLDMRTKPSLLSQLENMCYIIQNNYARNVRLRRWDGDTTRCYYLTFNSDSINSFMMEESVRLLNAQGYETTICFDKIGNTQGSYSYEMEVKNNEN